MTLTFVRGGASRGTLRNKSAWVILREVWKRPGEKAKSEYQGQRKARRKRRERVGSIFCKGKKNLWSKRQYQHGWNSLGVEGKGVTDEPKNELQEKGAENDDGALKKVQNNFT